MITIGPDFAPIPTCACTRTSDSTENHAAGTPPIVTLVTPPGSKAKPVPVIVKIVPEQYGSSFAVATFEVETLLPKELPTMLPALLIVTAPTDDTASIAIGVRTATHAAVRSSPRMNPLPLVSLDHAPLVTGSLSS